MRAPKLLWFVARLAAKLKNLIFTPEILGLPCQNGHVLYLSVYFSEVANIGLVLDFQNYEYWQDFTFKIKFSGNRE